MPSIWLSKRNKKIIEKKTKEIEIRTNGAGLVKGCAKRTHPLLYLSQPTGICGFTGSA